MQVDMHLDTIKLRFLDHITDAMLLVATLERSPCTNLHPQSFRHLQAQLDETHFWADTSFTSQQFNKIHDALKLPPVIRTHVQDCVESKVAFFMLCAYLRGQTQRTLEGNYGWSHSQISRTVRKLIDVIYKQWKHLLDVQSSRHCLVSAQKLEYYAATIECKFGIPWIWGAIDGTVRLIVRPMVQQELIYSGHKQFHGLKYQFILVPSRLIFCSKPEEGCKHDAYIPAKSRLPEWAESHARNEASQQMYLYSDQAYGISAAILTKFHGNIVSLYQSMFNDTMNRFHVQVEWAIGKIPGQWPHFDMKCQQKTGLTPVGKEFMVGVLLYNAKTCIVGNQMSQHMDCNPPDVEEYFSWADIRQTNPLPDPWLNQSGVNSPELAEEEEETIVENEL